MKRKKPRKIILQKELKRLMRNHPAGCESSWEFVRFDIENIGGLERLEEQYLLNHMKVYLGIKDKEA